MAKKLHYEAKEKMVSLAGACFWYWNSFYSFLDNCGVSSALQRRYPRESYKKYEMLRAILGDLERSGGHETIGAIASGFFRLSSAVDGDKLDQTKAKRLLQEFRDVIGNDPIEAEIRRKEREASKATHEKKIAGAKTQAKRLSDLNGQFMALHTDESITPQNRGYKLEDIFFELLHINEFEYSKPYRKLGEQIDGHFRYEKFDYLVEAKWTKEKTKQHELSIFDGKMRGKAQSTRGLFISANGFDANAITKFSGDAPRIVLMTGEDLALILGGQVLFVDAMKAKIDAIVRYGKILLPVRQIAT